MVVSARDEANMIGECLKSLRDQIANLFLVVVDDASVDGTDEVALKHAEVITLTTSKLVISRCAHFTRAIKESLGIRSLLTLFSYNSVPKSLV